MKKLCHSSVLSFCSPLLKASNMKKFLSLNFKKSFTHSLKNTSGTHLKSVKIRNEQKRKSFKRRQHFIRKLLKHFPHHNGYILEFDSSDFTVHCYLVSFTVKGVTLLRQGSKIKVMIPLLSLSLFCVRMSKFLKFCYSGA